jgi:hypothetical protein
MGRKPFQFVSVPYEGRTLTTPFLEKSRIPDGTAWCIKMGK